MAKVYWKYGLWTLTLMTVWWIVGLVSAIVGGKGMTEMREEETTSEHV